MFVSMLTGPSLAMEIDVPNEQRDVGGEYRRAGWWHPQYTAVFLTVARL
ncbi:MAG TPA: hypothetical protein VNO32_20600 [Candidatus Acidoferrum sp.]|nr:hypothetical protein [Candidatus Acidoferrum sp.]